MRVAVVYVFPQVDPGLHVPLARQFVQTWSQHPPGYAHQLYVVANGAHPQPAHLKLFEPLAAQWITHNNTGWDVGAYQMAAQTLDCDLLVCLGAHIRFHHPHWLAQMAESFILNGPGLYGPWGVRYPRWHIRTTAFWCPPQILQAYPLIVGSYRPQRYEFEHGERSLTAHTLENGFPCCMVTRQGVFTWPDWGDDRQPDREQSLILDKQHA